MPTVFDPEHPTDPAYLRANFGIRFHHFIDVNGRLVATLATEPDEVDKNVVWAACAIVAKSDIPSRARGRQIALGRLGSEGALPLRLDVLKEQITNRTILQHFAGGARFGRGKVPGLRPRAPYRPRKNHEVKAQP